MNSVLISIKPEWCAKILTGEKTIEVRKTKPSCQPVGGIAKPFKCYIYCSTVKNMTLAKYVEAHAKTGGKIDDWSGKVIAEFFCDRIWLCRHDTVCEETIVGTQMSPEQLAKYSGGKDLYGWNISQLKIYSEPLVLSDFCYPSEEYCEKGLCGGCPYGQVPNECREVDFDCEWQRPIEKPPQSWCYAKKINYSYYQPQIMTFDDPPDMPWSDWTIW